MYVKAADEVDFVEAIKGQADYFPLAFAVSPNGENKLGFIHAYLTAKSRSDTQWIESIDLGIFDYPVRNVLQRYVEIVHALNAHDSRLLLRACDFLCAFLANVPSKNADYVPDFVVPTVRFLQGFALECFLPLERGSSYLHGTPNIAYRSWWDSAQPTILAKLQRVKNDLPKQFVSPPNGLLAVDRWLDEVITRFKLFKAVASASQTRVRALYEASAYCAALAERYLREGHAAMAILLLHRASDLLFFAKCAELGVIDFAFRGGRYISAYAPSGNRPNLITLLNSLDILIHYGSISASQAESDFKELNEWRNLLIQTHFMSDAEDVKAVDLFTKIRIHLEKYSNRDWIASRDKHVGGVAITIEKLIDLDGSLASTFSAINI